MKLYVHFTQVVLQLFLSKYISSRCDGMKATISGEMISETLPLVRPVGAYKFRNFVFRTPPPIQIQKCLVPGTPLPCDTLLDFVNVKMNFYRHWCNIFTDSVQKESVTFTILCPKRVCKFYQTVFCRGVYILIVTTNLSYVIFKFEV